MSYFSLYYHLVWHTKNSSPILKDEKAKRVQEIIKSIIFSNPEMFFVTIGGITNHVHVVIYSKSTISVARMAQVIKGGSSEMINESRIFPFKFSWQHEYGCSTFAEQDLQKLMDYVSHQYEHHLKKAVDVKLERTDFRDFGLPHAWGDDE